MGHPVSFQSKSDGQGVPLPPLQKIFIADLDELEHAKKVVKMSKFENSQFFFNNEYFPKIQVISTLKQAEKAFKSQNSSDQIAERTDNHEHI